MNPPPPEVQWISLGATVVATLIAVTSLGINIAIAWRNRRRVEFRVLTAAIYYEQWNEHDLDLTPPTIGQTRPDIKPGDYRRAFAVTEFAIKNEFPIEITVGRFIIDDWMFADRYQGEMYAPKRDYRVYDLITRQENNLAHFWNIPSKGSINLRLEVFEDTDGPVWRSSHSRYVIKLPQAYTVKFIADSRTYQHKIRFKERKKIQDGFAEAHRWSDLLKAHDLSTFPAPLPQGVHRQPYRTPWWAQVRTWVKWKYVWLVYGKGYWLAGRPTRWQQIMIRSRAKEKDDTNSRSQG